MRHFSLSLAAVFLFSSLLLGQHSSTGSSSSSSSGGGGGGSHSSSGGSASSGSSGGGSHSSYSGGSSGGSHSSAGGGHSSAGGGHSSSGGVHTSNVGGSTAHSSNAHGTSVHSSSSFASTHSEERDLRTSVTRGVHEPTAGSHVRPVTPERRGFFSFLRHPFWRPERKDPAPDLRHRVCLQGPCQVCPNGMVAGKGGCGRTVVYQQNYNVCAPTQIWRGGACVAQTWMLEDCSGYRAMMDRQAQRLQAAESIRQSACAAGNTQECSTATASWQSEMDLYRSLQASYQRCILQSRTPYRFSQHNPYFSNGLRTDPLSTEWSDTEQIW